MFVWPPLLPRCWWWARLLGQPRLRQDHRSASGFNAVGAYAAFAPVVTVAYQGSNGFISCEGAVVTTSSTLRIVDNINSIDDDDFSCFDHLFDDSSDFYSDFDFSCRHDCSFWRASHNGLFSNDVDWMAEQTLRLLRVFSTIFPITPLDTTTLFWPFIPPLPEEVSLPPEPPDLFPPLSTRTNLPLVLLSRRCARPIDACWWRWEEQRDTPPDGNTSKHRPKSPLFRPL